MQKAAQAYWTLERETVKAGLRSCTTTHVNPERLNHDLAELAKQGLIFLPRVKVGTYSGFAHRHPAVEPGKAWNWYGPIGRSTEAVRAFFEAEEQGDHETIGRLLGYPECCTAFFRDVWMQGYVDPVFQSAIRSQSVIVSQDGPSTVEISDAASLTWSGSRYIGLRFAAHLACAFDCKWSVKVTNQWLELGRRLKICGVSELHDLMHMPVEWSALHGVALVTTPIFRVVTNTVPCHPTFTVRKQGEFIPSEAARGLRFPFVQQHQEVPA